MSPYDAFSCGTKIKDNIPLYLYLAICLAADLERHFLQIKTLNKVTGFSGS